VDYFPGEIAVLITGFRGFFKKSYLHVWVLGAVKAWVDPRNFFVQPRAEGQHLSSCNASRELIADNCRKFVLYLTFTFSNFVRMIFFVLHERGFLPKRVATSQATVPRSVDRVGRECAKTCIIFIRKG
jgi:hypothetical protein